MRLLTYHGTIVRRPVDGPGLVHEPLRAVDPAFEDVWIGETGATEGTVVEPGVVPGTIRLKQNGFYVCAEPAGAALVANRAAAGIWETFLLLSDMEVALLRLLLGHGWRASGAAGPGEVPVMRPGFGLTIGDQAIDLTAERPGVGSIAFAAVAGSAPVRVFDRGAGAAVPGELPLGPAPEERRRLPLAGRAEFLAGSERALAVAAAPDWYDLPIAADPGDSAFVQQRYWHGGAPKLREQRAGCQVRRSRGKFVLLQRFCEGILFDEHGTYSEAGYFHTLHTFPNGLRREGGTMMLDRRLLAEAPRLPGPYAVVFNPHLSNYYHWLVESMLPLDVMQHELPEGTRLLLPGTLAGLQTSGSGFDHRRILRLLGFGHIPMVEVDAPVCHVEEAVWLEKYGIDQIPGQALRAFRARIETRLGIGRPRRRRIYIERQGLRRIANAAAVEAFCREHGFSVHRLEETSDDEQIRLFQEAEFVLAGHGAGLSNLLFCPAGTKVVELSPDAEFRPFFWQIAQRLGLHYGVLPCPTSDGTFHGSMTVDLERLGRLYRCVQAASMPGAVAE